ncbi:MAG TPA: 2,3,4,5-tetrahydropyridine-2,6-dicarboxylate N-succinyltransferase [Candidatus Polarisedimenticolaceae bacterium]|nr:2,3,4,5-tetrahydropyridine-2,6-dicarboxylate N-succinyltransferase [Candidatus Polarisedimenticolaceae bacterium]
MTPEALRASIETLSSDPAPDPQRGRAVVEALLSALEAGEVRAALPRDGTWQVQPWVKQGILLAFRLGSNVEVPAGPVFHFRDRDTFPTWDPATSGRNVRVVPGGTTVRRGAYLGEGVVVMPPAYVNVGAFVGARTLVDSHALVGSCAQVGSGVHLSAAAQVGGVLEPVGAVPVVVEDDVFVGGNCGIFEGTRVCARAVLAAGVVLTRAVALVDLVHERVLRAQAGEPLTIPEGAVVVPGARPAGGPFAGAQGVMLQTPVIVKYRDASTDAAAALEEALR